MTKADILEVLTELFREIFDDDSIVLTSATAAKDIDGWDSFVHVTISIGIEERFRIKFQTAEIETLLNVGDMIDLIDRKLSERDVTSTLR
jgi:acyl carrier protein